MKILTCVHRLEFRYPFRIAHGIRTGTDAVYVRIESANHIGYGEATLPPYLLDTIESTLAFFSNTYFQNIQDDFIPDEISQEIEQLIPGNYPAKAALNMALWQCYSSKKAQSISENLGIKSDLIPPHSYTLGIGSKDEMKVKLQHGLDHGFEFFKLKLDGVNDIQVATDYLSLSQYPFAVDVNQGWKDFTQAIDIAQFLETFGCVLIEQPFHKSDVKETSDLRKHISIPIIADEACQVPSDINHLLGVFDGINIKLQKCGGISPALQMIQIAKEHHMKVLIGCMSESSVGCNAAESLASLCDWADLDGPWLIKNDPDIELIFQ